MKITLLWFAAVALMVVAEVKELWEDLANDQAVLPALWKGPQVFIIALFALVAFMNLKRYSSLRRQDMRAKASLTPPGSPM